VANIEKLTISYLINLMRW